MGFGVKPVLSPTKLEQLKAIKTCDIINPSPQGLAGDICYLSAIYNLSEMLLYDFHIFTCIGGWSAFSL